ncbi:MAG: type II restriction endonuclease [bacterium]
MKSLIESAKSRIPSIDDILNEAWNRLQIKEITANSQFGQTLVNIDSEATKVNKEYEKQALFELTKGWLDSQQECIKDRLKMVLWQNEWDDFASEASKILIEFGSLVQNFEKILGNMRKARGGKNFERTILKILNLINIKAEAPSWVAKELLRRIDIVIPSVRVALETPDKAIFLTCKRTLRERWRQEIPQVKPNQRVYLLTIDEQLSRTKAREINEKALIAFVRDDLKQVEYIKDMPWIRKLSDLPEDLRRL